MLHIYKQKCNSSGWTLIELLVVLTIILVLALIALPKFSDTTRPAYRQLMQAELLQIAQQLEENYSQNQLYQDIPLDPFPSEKQHYSLSLTISNNGKSFTLQATPLNSQKEDGLLYFDSSGEKRRYQGVDTGGSYVPW